MADGGNLSPALAAELAGLDDDQRRAAREPGDLVVLAGPGSGKTRTLVARAGYLLEACVPSQQGIAVITYTRHAAREIRARLEQLGIRPGRRLITGTLHSWCLNSILQPYGHLADVPDAGDVVSDDSDLYLDLLQSCLDDARVPGKAREKHKAIAACRRNLATDPAAARDEPLARAARLLEERMLEQGWFDFDLIASQALALVRQHSHIARLAAGRYPWILVDEYQDLGPVLHALVLALHQTTNTRITAFGDADQSVMGFTGADPRYFRELPELLGCDPAILRVNHRSGETIIDAGKAVLIDPRPYCARPERTDPGAVVPIRVAGSLAAHGTETVAAIRDAVSRGVPEHQIAVLYPGKGRLLDTLLTALRSSPHDFVHERDEGLPEGDLADFVRECASRTVTGLPAAASSPDSPIPLPLSLPDLVREYEMFRAASELPPMHGNYGATRALAMALDRAPGTPSESEPLEQWLSRLVKALDLESIGVASRDHRDRSALDAFRVAGQRHRLTVRDIAAGPLRAGKVTLTTYHSAKGREWDVVIMPGLVDGIMPVHPEPWQTRDMDEHSRVEQDRRAFYVGITRARNTAVLIHGDRWTDRRGKPRKTGSSRFVQEILRHIASATRTT